MFCAFFCLFTLTFLCCFGSLCSSGFVSEAHYKESVSSFYFCFLNSLSTYFDKIFSFHSSRLTSFYNSSSLFTFCCSSSFSQSMSDIFFNCNYSSKSSISLSNFLIWLSKFYSPLPNISFWGSCFFNSQNLFIFQPFSSISIVYKWTLLFSITSSLNYASRAFKSFLCSISIVLMLFRCSCVLIPP